VQIPRVGTNSQLLGVRVEQDGRILLLEQSVLDRIAAVGGNPA
jgi:hypothetical protein